MYVKIVAIVWVYIFMFHIHSDTHVKTSTWYTYDLQSAKHHCGDKTPLVWEEESEKNKQICQTVFN